MIRRCPKLMLIDCAIWALLANHRVTQSRCRSVLVPNFHFAGNNACPPICHEFGKDVATSYRTIEVFPDLNLDMPLARKSRVAEFKCLEPADGEDLTLSMVAVQGDGEEGMLLSIDIATACSLSLSVCRSFCRGRDKGCDGEEDVVLPGPKAAADLMRRLLIGKGVDGFADLIVASTIDKEDIVDSIGSAGARSDLGKNGHTGSGS
ncbi:hypothetical protein ACLOJK_026915 [Asimina triloba]